jgi:hypothetical protein
MDSSSQNRRTNNRDERTIFVIPRHDIRPVLSRVVHKGRIRCAQLRRIAHVTTPLGGNGSDQPAEGYPGLVS